MPNPHFADRELPESITRVHVVGHDGTLLETFAAGWDVAVLDEGRTVKLFARGTPEQAERARRSRRQSLARDLATISAVAAKHRRTKP